MKPLPRPICITSNDVHLVTVDSYRQSLRLLQEIAKSLDKAVKFVMINEFYNYTGLKIEEVENTEF